MDNPITQMKTLRSLITGDQLEIRPLILSAGFRAEILEINFYKILLILENLDQYSNKAFGEFQIYYFGQNSRFWKVF